MTIWPHLHEPKMGPWPRCPPPPPAAASAVYGRCMAESICGDSVSACGTVAMAAVWPSLSAVTVSLPVDRGYGRCMAESICGDSVSACGPWLWPLYGRVHLR